MAKDDFAGGDTLQQDVVPPEEVAGAGRAAGKGADAHVGKVVGADERRPIDRSAEGAKDFAEIGRASCRERV